jgi:hypothetical protein
MPIADTIDKTSIKTIKINRLILIHLEFEIVGEFRRLRSVVTEGNNIVVEINQKIVMACVYLWK